MTKQFNNKTIRLKGFTLVELLVSIGIIALLSAIIVVNVTNARAKARDARRETDIKTLGNALSLYFSIKGIYPVYSGAITGNDAMSQELINSETANETPLDPVRNGTCVPSMQPYIYCYASEDGKVFTISYFLETDSILGKAIGLQQVSQ